MADANKSEYLNSIFLSKRNGLNLVRLVAAITVLVSHVGWLAGNDISWVRMMGPKAVAVFFGISGFLISHSWEKSPNFLHFIRNRLLRLWPALIVVLVLTALIFYPAYLFLNPSSAQSVRVAPAFLYIVKNLFFHQFQTQIAGTPYNPNSSYWNPSLWTLEFEMYCYILTPAIGFLVHHFKKS